MSEIDNLKEEFDRFKDYIFYMDWNVISYLSNPLEISNDDMKSKTLRLNQIIFKLLDRSNFVIPYSNAHMLDINNGSSKYIDSSLEFLDEISRKWEISECPNDKEKICLNKIGDIFVNHNDYIANLDETKRNIDVLSTTMIPIFDHAKDYIKETSDLQNLPKILRGDIQELIQCIFPMNDEELNIRLLKLNKKFKFNAKNLENKRIKFPNYNSVKLKYPKSNIREVVDLCIKISDLPFESLSDMTDKIDFVHYSPALSKFNNSINESYFLAEFLDVSSEKLTSKTAFQGIINDQLHLNYGLRCKYFITEDNALYKKALFIKEWLQLSTQVFKIDDLTRFLLTEIINSDNVSDKKEITYTFKDDKGIII